MIHYATYDAEQRPVTACGRDASIMPRRVHQLTRDWESVTCPDCDPPLPWYWRAALWFTSRVLAWFALVTLVYLGFAVGVGTAWILTGGWR